MSRPATQAFALLSLLAGALALAGCHHGGTTPKKDAGPDEQGCKADGGTRATNGATCGCDAECASGFCVDGVCCDTACTETCKSCKTAAAPGICSFVAAGDPPRTASECPKSDVSNCGDDGTCDGQGACRLYPLQTVCSAGTCSGASVVGVRICDGQGTCSSGPSVVTCAPFNCTSQGACSDTCASDGDCAPGIKCAAGSCGQKQNGVSCTLSAQCASSFCVDKICCASACTGACVSCNQTGHLGTCEPTARGAADPHTVCHATAQSTCGQTGTCDGVGGCARYAAETVCISATCSGSEENTAGTCDGRGTCRPQGVQDCGFYECEGGACVNHCTSDSDCVYGRSCKNGSCGPKTNGQPCSAGSECNSTFCVDGVCCNSACTGACHSCALSTSRGTCAPSPAGGPDPRGSCSDQHPSSCGTDGTCDGAGSCHKYKMGTECGAESCSAGTYTPTSTCDANGNCHTPDALTCAPYVCNGSRCFGSCTDNSACSGTNVCTGTSCGPKPLGAFCSAGAECASLICAQGICCATACAGACHSCAITGSMGQCTAVASGPDPASLCASTASTSCGTDGKCQAGACEKYQQGTACQNAGCPPSGTTFTPGGSCDGAGTCAVPSSSSCAPFACGTNACKATCAADGDCAPGNFCTNGSCGPKPNGAVCAAGGECKSGICAQGVCCATTCTGSCMSCALSLSGAAGTCTPITAGSPDPTGHCTDQGAASCGMTGFCDGTGACALYAGGIQCVPAACPATGTTASQPRTCDGNGTCKPATTQPCAPFACNAAGTACVSVCASGSDCAPGKVCDTTTGKCGLKRLGQACGDPSECDSGNCVDGVCCSTASCGSCRVCNLMGSPGTCQPVTAATPDPKGMCTVSTTCGFDGTCDGNGACQNAAPGKSCGMAMCSGTSAAIPIGSCDGNGACVQTPQPCGAYLCSANACLTMCGGDGDCTSGDTCQMGMCTNLKPLGKPCGASADCISNLCTEGVCCSSGPCGSCLSCAVTGKQGNCAPVAAGPDPAGLCMDQGATTCGTDGLCDGAGHCADYPSSTPCAPAACGTATSLNAASACDGAGHCAPASTTDCTPFACTGAACNTSCLLGTDCAAGHTCQLDADGGPGTCAP